MDVGKDCDRVHCCAFDHARHRDPRLRADADRTAECCDCVEHSVSWTGNRPLLARRNQLHDPAPMGGRIRLRASSWFRVCQRTNKRRAAPERAAVGAIEFQRWRGAGSGCFCHLDCVTRTLFPTTPNPLATVGGGIARLRGRLCWRVLDDPTNGHLVGGDQVSRRHIALLRTWPGSVAAGVSPAKFEATDTVATTEAVRSQSAAKGCQAASLTRLAGCQRAGSAKLADIQRWRLVVFLLLLWPVTAFAHTRGGEAIGFVSGFEHPISGWDHVLAMMAVGLWGAQLGPPA